MSSLQMNLSKHLRENQMLSELDTILYEDLGLIIFFSFCRQDILVRERASSRFKEVSGIFRAGRINKSADFFGTFASSNKGFYLESVLNAYRHQPRFAFRFQEEISVFLKYCTEHFCESIGASPCRSWQVLDMFMTFNYMAHAEWIKKLTSEDLAFSPGMVLAEFSSLIEQ